MLSTGKATDMDFTPRYVWGNNDWDRIASELQRIHSDWRTHPFTMNEFEDAMETVIAQEHHRAFMSMEDVTPHLFMAFARRSPGKTDPLTPNHKSKVLQTTTGAIRWTPGEWELVVLEMHRVFPTKFNDRCTKLSIPELRAAQLVLPLSRRREPNQIEIYRKQLLKTWDALPADVRDPRLQDRKIVDFPSGPIMEPPRQKSDATSAIATAMHKGFQAPEKVKKEKPVKLGKVKQKRHYYDATDWLNIAREMYRQNPHAPYFTSAFQTVDLPALRAAQREIIPIERRRTIAGNFGLAKPLVAAFQALKEEIDAQKTEPEQVKAEPAIEEPNSPIEQPQPMFRPGVITATVKVQEVAPLKVIPPVQSDFLSRIAAASKPLIGVLVEEFRDDIAQAVAKILLPQITGALAPMLDTALQGVKEAIAAQFNPWANSPLPIATPDYHQGATAVAVQEQKTIPSPISTLQIPTLKPIEKPKKLKIAIIGPRGSQQEQVVRAFPEYEFVFIENGHGIKEAGTNCALVVALNAYMNRANRDTMKAHVPPEKVRFIDGGMSTIKRTINVWKISQSTAKNPTVLP